MHHETLGAVESWEKLTEKQQTELIAFYDEGTLDRDSLGDLIEAMLIGDLRLLMETSVRIRGVTDSQFTAMSRVIIAGMPLAAQGSKVNVQAYMRSHRDRAGRL